MISFYDFVCINHSDSIESHVGYGNSNVSQTITE